MITIDPGTLQLEGYDRRRSYTADDFATLTAALPACPVCGTRVNVDRIDVTWNAEQEIREGRQYIPGRWECPRYCNPKTGERYHGDWSLSTDASGWRYVCSCGVDERGAGAAELGRLHAEHGGKQ